MYHLKCVKLVQKGFAGEPHLTSTSPPLSFAASCPAGPPSGRALPHRPSGPTGPAFGPSFPVSPRYAAGPRWEDKERHCCSGGRGWDNPAGRQRGGDVAEH